MSRPRFHPKNFREVLNQIPPTFALICGLRAHTEADLAGRAGWSMQKFSWVSRQKSFDLLTVKEADTFLSACGITPSNAWQHAWFLRRTLTKSARPLRHLRRMPTKEQERLAMHLYP